MGAKPGAQLDRPVCGDRALHLAFLSPPSRFLPSPPRWGIGEPGHRSQRWGVELCLDVCSDYVYFENSSSNPYLIRRIEELNKTATGNVEAKVVCFYRRRDISNTLIMLADKHAKEIEEESETTIEADLTDKQKHQLKHRELFLSRQYESLPATHIRGKCSVALLNETESVLSYLDKEDTFFYSLVYDPSVKTLLADKGEIRVGPRYQADIPEMLLEGESDEREQSKLEVKVWDPNSPLTDRQIDQFLVVARAVGTFARALDCSSSVRQPSLHMSAAAASRDITLFHAMDTLYRHSYDLSSAISVLVPLGGPVLCRDEMEEWSASEASLFEEALEKYGKDFNDIRQDFVIARQGLFLRRRLVGGRRGLSLLEALGDCAHDYPLRSSPLPWKSLTSIIEYYYMWKTTDRYVQQKRLKAAEAESKLKQVSKPNPNQISASNGKPGAVNGAVGTTFQPQNPLVGRACESCYGKLYGKAAFSSPSGPGMQCVALCVALCSHCGVGGVEQPSRATQSHQWYSWGPPNMQCRLCATCWLYWKKYGGLKMPTQSEEEKLSPSPTTEDPRVRSHMSRQAMQGMPVRNTGSPKSAVKTRQAFFLHTTYFTKFARQVCKNTLRLRQAARRPFVPINYAAIRAEYADRHAELSGSPLKSKSTRKPLACIIGYLEIHPSKKPNVIRSTPSLQTPTTKRMLTTPNHTSLSILGKRNYSHHNGLDGILGLLDSDLNGIRNLPFMSSPPWPLEKSIGQVLEGRGGEQEHGGGHGKPPPSPRLGEPNEDHVGAPPLAGGSRRPEQRELRPLREGAAPPVLAPLRILNLSSQVARTLPSASTFSWKFMMKRKRVRIPVGRKDFYLTLKKKNDGQLLIIFLKLFGPYHSPYCFWKGEHKNYISVRERGEKRNKRRFTESPKGKAESEKIQRGEGQMGCSGISHRLLTPKKMPSPPQSAGLPLCGPDDTAFVPGVPLKQDSVSGKPKQQAQERGEFSQKSAIKTTGGQDNIYRLVLEGPVWAHEVKAQLCSILQTFLRMAGGCEESLEDQLWEGELKVSGGEGGGGNESHYDMTRYTVLLMFTVMPGKEAAPFPAHFSGRPSHVPPGDS
ncbi:hypothetical protein GH733_009056, partial [Mirounga leonina]